MARRRFICALQLEMRYRAGFLEDLGRTYIGGKILYMTRRACVRSFQVSEVYVFFGKR